MKEILEDLTTRETSVLIWSVLIFSVLIFFSRKEFLNILKAFFNIKIVIPLTCFGIYCIIIIILLFKVDLWDFKLLKDTIIWFFSAGLIIFFDTNKIQNTSYFKQLLKSNLKIIIFLEFVLNFYTFSFLSELLLIPILTIITLVYEYSKYSMQNKPAHVKVNRVMKSLLTLFGIIILVSVIGRLINDYENLFTVENVKSIYLPIILTVISFPFIYLLALVMIYEEFFMRINFMFTDKKIKKELKKQIIINANFSLNKLSNVKNKMDKKLIYNQNISDYIKSIL